MHAWSEVEKSIRAWTWRTASRRGRARPGLWNPGRAVPR